MSSKVPNNIRSSKNVPFACTYFRRISKSVRVLVFNKLYRFLIQSRLEKFINHISKIFKTNLKCKHSNHVQIFTELNKPNLAK